MRTKSSTHNYTKPKLKAKHKRPPEKKKDDGKKRQGPRKPQPGGQGPRKPRPKKK